MYSKIYAFLILITLSGSAVFGQWNSLTSPTTLQMGAVSFPTKDTGYIGGTDGKIFKTTDGGNTWTALNSGMNRDIFSMDFTSASTGYACATGATILKTTDGGQTWSQQQISGAATYLIEIRFANDSVGFCVGYSGTILRTTNRGVSWTKLTSNTNNDIRSVYFINKDTGFVSAVYDEILRTTDGGDTWTSYPSGGTNRFIASLYFVNDSIGFGVGSNIITKTTDCGLTWRLIQPVPYRFLQSVYFRDENIGYAAGERGILLTTYNGGESWSEQYLGNFSNQYGWYDITFSNGVGYASGYLGNLIKTTCAPIVSHNTHSACDSFTWIDGNTYLESNTIATKLYPGGSANGCDSAVILNLTINKISDKTTSRNGTTITANSTTASYRWLDCDNNYAPISGETNQSFTAVNNGSYAVELTENGCVDTSECISIQGIGFGENDFGTGFRLYPNPTKGDIIIEIGEQHKTIDISIFDLQGKVIETYVFDNVESMSISTDIPEGIYFVQIRSGQKSAMVKLVRK